MNDRIASLQQEYAGIHDRVLAAYQNSDNPDIRDLQARENIIVSELRALGAQPYGGDR